MAAAIACRSASAVASSVRRVGQFGSRGVTVEELLDLADHMLQRPALVARDLAEEEVLRLDRGGAFVERVDLGVADVLLDRIVLQEPGTAERLQRFGQALVRALGADTLHDRQQQIVDPVGHFGVGTGHDLGDDDVLMGGGIEVERPQPLGVRLLREQRPSHVGMMNDGDARRALVGHLRQVGALNPGLRVVQRIQIAGRQCRDRLGTDHHSRVLDHLEHLRDAVVGVADQPADGGAVVLTEREFASGRNLQAHLVFESGDVNPVALAGFAGLGIEMELRHQEQAQSLGARSGALRPGQHQVSDVLEQVVGVAVGDEPLDAVEVPGAVGLLDRLGAAGADVRSGVGFGEHHGGAPIALDHQRRPVRCCSLPMPYRMSAKIGPARYMNAAGWAPRASSLIAQASIDGAGTPPTFSSRPMRNHSPAAMPAATS